MCYPWVYELPLQGSGARKYDKTFWQPSMTSSTVRAVPRSRVRPSIPTPLPLGHRRPPNTLPGRQMPAITKISAEYLCCW